jgi:3-methyladenine DNA glycosylase Tag
MNTGCIAIFSILFIEKCQAGLVYLFVSKFRATFAKYKEAEAMNKKSLQIIWTKNQYRLLRIY